jgi:ankyrin repeat protein
LRALFAESPALAKTESQGNTPLMWLPTDDEQLAIAIARRFIEYGANRSIRTKEGATAADRAERLGMFALAELLRNGLATF